MILLEKNSNSYVSLMLTRIVTDYFQDDGIIFQRNDVFIKMEFIKYLVIELFMNNSNIYTNVTLLLSLKHSSVLLMIYELRIAKYFRIWFILKNIQINAQDIIHKHGSSFHKAAIRGHLSIVE